MSDLPSELKQIAPYIQRAQELATVDPVVSYFCTYYAARLAIASGSNTPASQAYLSQLLDQLETEKERIKEDPKMANDLVASQHCKTFALKVFAKADTEDRNGRATKVTARNFIVASQFLQILAGFGELPEDVQEKVRYAKWKAADIVKALREGRQPTQAPGEQQQQQQQQQPDAGSPQPNVTASDIFAWPSPPAVSAPAQSMPPAQPMPPVQPTTPQQPTSVVQNSQFDSLPSVPLQPHVSKSPATSAAVAPMAGSATFVPVPAANLPAADGELLVDPAVTKNAQKMARWAISALEYDDVDNAISNLQKAIEMLKPFRNSK